MNTEDYGQHASDYRRPEPDELLCGFTVRLILWAAAFACCIDWVMFHAGCAHPIGNGITLFVESGFVPLRLLCLVSSEAGVE